MWSVALRLQIKTSVLSPQESLETIKGGVRFEDDFLISNSHTHRSNFRLVEAKFNKLTPLYVLLGGNFESILNESTYKTDMTLRIKSVGPNDFGSYKCIAKNSLGEITIDIKLVNSVVWLTYDHQLYYFPFPRRNGQHNKTLQ